MFIPVLLEQLNLLHLFRLLDASDIQYMKSSNTTKPCTSRRACNRTKTTSFKFCDGICHICQMFIVATSAVQTTLYMLLWRVLCLCLHLSCSLCTHEVTKQLPTLITEETNQHGLKPETSQNYMLPNTACSLLRGCTSCSPMWTRKLWNTGMKQKVPIHLALLSLGVVSSASVSSFYRTSSYASAVLSVIILSVRPSVCLLHARFVTISNNTLRIFWYHTEGQSL